MVTDNELVELTLKGHTEAFAELYTRWEQPIQRYILRLVGYHMQDAQDIVSEVFMRCYTKLASFNPRKKFSSWLYRIAHNHAINWMKKNRRVHSVDVSEIDIPTDVDWDTPNKLDIEAVLGRLSLADRTILILFYLEDRTLQEIGEMLKITSNNAAVKLNRARTKAKRITHPKQ